MYLFASGGPQPDYLPANGWPNGHVSQVGFCKTNGNDFSRFRWCKTYGHATARPVPVTFAIHRFSESHTNPYFRVHFVFFMVYNVPVCVAATGYNRLPLFRILKEGVFR
jgi:hypothetical protein